MNQNLIDQLEKDFPSDAASTLRPTMHKVKSLTPFITAIRYRQACGQAACTIEQAIGQHEHAIDTILASLELKVEPEWQRAAIRKSTLSLAAQDIRSYGEVTEDWVKDFLQTIDLTRQNDLSAFDTPFPSDYTTLALTKLNSITRLLTTLNDFSFLHDPRQLSTDLFHRVVEDSRALAESLSQKTSITEKNMMESNLIKNLNDLMIGAIKVESQRIGTLTQADIINNPDGLPLDSVITTYTDTKSILESCMSDDFIFESAQNDHPRRTPSFLI